MPWSNMVDIQPRRTVKLSVLGLDSHRKRTQDSATAIGYLKYMISGGIDPKYFPENIAARLHYLLLFGCKGSRAAQDFPPFLLSYEATRCLASFFQPPLKCIGNPG